MPRGGGNARSLCRQRIVDRTELPGSYTFDLSWARAPELLPPGAASRLAPAFDPNAPTLETSLQEQLGLRFDSERGPAEVVVIERVEPPSEK